MFQKEKTPFQALKTRNSKSRENGNFPKWFVRGFGLKFFPSFISCKKGRENAFHDILEGKNVFLRYKNKKFKKSKNQNFFIGVSP